MIQIKIIPSYTYIHSSEKRFANALTSVSRMQNCPITTSPYRRCVFLRYQTLRRVGLLLQDCRRAIYQTTRRRPGGESFRILWGGENGGLLPPNSLTTRLHGGRGKTTNSSDAGCRRFASYSTSHAILL